MKKIAELIKRFPFILDVAHGLGVIIIALDIFAIINSFQASQFLDWNIYEQIAFRTIGGFLIGILVSFVWEGQIQEDKLKMKASKRDVYNMTTCATLTGLFLPYLNFSNWTLIISTFLLIVAIFVYLKVFFNSKKQ
jgi:hypothetical protein